MLIQKEVMYLDLATRKQKVLAAIATGEPVGSKSLLEQLDISVSSATIRNEMADLTSRGYLLQPHTSAGRIPSQKGYRFYVDNFLKTPALHERIKDRQKFRGKGKQSRKFAGNCLQNRFGNYRFSVGSNCTA